MIMNQNWNNDLDYQKVFRGLSEVLHKKYNYIDKD